MKVIVGVTGATGVEMSLYLLKALHSIDGCEIHLVVSDAAQKVWALETQHDINKLLELADVVYDPHNMAASISSGSYITEGIIVMPCSMKTLAGIAAGYSDNLIIRATDVCLKEGRKVVLVPREIPLSKVHLRNLIEAADVGCTIVPPILTFYNGSKTMEGQISHIIGKVLMQFGISYDKFKPWVGAD
jgi:4-hydroxy-3-polyprenylbenzoate decarboxylase